MFKNKIFFIGLMLLGITALHQEGATAVKSQDPCADFNNCFQKNFNNDQTCSDSTKYKTKDQQAQCQTERNKYWVFYCEKLYDQNDIHQCLP